MNPQNSKWSSSKIRWFKGGLILGISWHHDSTELIPPWIKLMNHPLGKEQKYHRLTVINALWRRVLHPQVLRFSMFLPGRGQGDWLVQICSSRAKPLGWESVEQWRIPWGMVDKTRRFMGKLTTLTWISWQLEHFFPYIGNNHPKWLIFFRGVQITNQ